MGSLPPLSQALEMTNYSRGYAFELRVKRVLERRGYFVVRSAGSHGVADLLAVRKVYPRVLGGVTRVEVLAVQCKRDGRISREELAELIATAGRYGMLPRLAYLDGRKMVLNDASKIIN